MVRESSLYSIDDAPAGPVLCGLNEAPEGNFTDYEEE